MGLIFILVACGSGSTDQAEHTAEQPTVTSAPSTPQPEDDDEGGGILRTVRDAPGTLGGWIWDGGNWVWNQISRGGSAIWDAIRSGSDFLWTQVTSLPGNAWDQISRFWNWMWGTGIGENLKDAGSVLKERAKSLNPSNLLPAVTGFLWGLLVALLKAVGVIILLVLIVVGIFRWRVWSHAIRLFWGGIEKQLSRISTPSFAPHESTKQNEEAINTTSKDRSGPIDKLDQDMVSSLPQGERLVDEVEVHGFETPLMTDSTAGDREHLWSREQIRELRDRVSNQTIITLFGLASDRDGQPVNYLELMRATGRSAAQVRADFSGFSRISRAVHLDESWPIDTVEPTDGKSRRAYVIPEQYLEWWFESD